MKKILAFTLVLVMSLMLVACVNSNDVPSKESYTSKNENSVDTDSIETKDTFGLNDTAVFKDIKVTATEFKESSGKEFFEPEDGNIFVGVKFVIENISNETQSISSLLQFSSYVDNVATDYSMSATIAFDNSVDGDIEPGKRLEGWYALEVPNSYKVIEVFFQHDILSSTKTQFVFKK